jgi:hypothetical protein
MALSGLTFAAALACAANLTAAAKPLSEEDVSAAVLAIVKERSKDGVFAFRDAATGEDLALALEDVRVVRGLPEFGWFPEVIFHERETPAKKYAVDFWLKPEGDRLKLMDVRVHKGPKPDGDTWMMITRRPLLWWWLPTLKRASAVSGLQAWQVMGTVHAHIVSTGTDGAFPLVDADGKTIPAELIAIYQPVGRIKENGGYFVCAQLRNKGNPAAVYAVDFKLDPDARSVSVGTALLQENSGVDNGKPAPEPGCRFEGLAFDVVE